jgi:hypothetical protein
MELNLRKPFLFSQLYLSAVHFKFVQLVDLRELALEGVSWIRLEQDRDQ